MADVGVNLARASKGELLDEVVRLRAIIDAPKPAARELDAESKAIDLCVKALGPLSPSRSGNLTLGAYRGTDGVARVLRYLAQRFGVSLIEVEPCERVHVDELGLVDLGDLVRGRLS